MWNFEVNKWNEIKVDKYWLESHYWDKVRLCSWRDCWVEIWVHPYVSEVLLAVKKGVIKLDINWVTCPLCIIGWAFMVSDILDKNSFVKCPLCKAKKNNWNK